MVDERRRPAEGEATPLDERTADRGGILANAVFNIEVHERPQRAVGSLRARVDREVTAVPGCVPSNGAVLSASWRPAHAGHGR